MKKILVITLLFAGVISDCFAQPESTPILQINDIVPDLSFTVSEGEKDFKRKLSDYKGKIVLFDFWGVNCTDCIAGIPKMLELQRKFGERIQIILVTDNSEEQIQKLWKKLASLPFAVNWIKAGKQMPFIKNDSVIRKLFPHKGLPTHVWIGKNREYISIAYSSSTTEGNIKKIIAGAPINWDHIKGVNLNVDTLLDNPISWFENDLGVKQFSQYYSFIVPRIEFGEGGFSPAKLLLDNSSGKVQGISCMNKTIIELYKEAYSNDLPLKPTIPANRIILEVNDKSKYYAPIGDSTYFTWANKNVFCYALKSPCDSVTEIYSYMKNDLDRFFKINSSVEKRNVMCWVFKRIATESGFKTKGGTSKYERGPSGLILRNSPISNLFYSIEDVINLQYPHMPLVDVTNFSDEIDIDLPWNEDLKTISIPNLRKALQKFGLDVTEEYFPIEMLVIRERQRK